MNMQLCTTATTTLRGEPCLPSQACKYSSGLTGSTYRACGEAALYAMALLQVHQAKAPRDLQEGGHDLAVLHEGGHAVSGLCDVHSCGPGAPSLVVSRWHEGAREGTVPECSRVVDREAFH